MLAAGILREYLPLKQELRHKSTATKNGNFCWLREYLPLKQGLRLISRL